MKSHPEREVFFQNPMKIRDSIVGQYITAGRKKRVKPVTKDNSTLMPDKNGQANMNPL